MATPTLWAKGIKICFLGKNRQSAEKCPNSVGIVDDILCHGNEETTHDVAVITLLETARVNNLTFNANKFVLSLKIVHSSEETLPQPGIRWTPKRWGHRDETTREPSRSAKLLGLVNYLNRLRPAQADLTAPLRTLCKKDTLFTWESSQQTAFEAIKKEITSASALTYFDRSKASTIQSDASKKGLGAVLIQDGESVIYASRALTETEQSYSKVERELHSVVFALERFHHYMCMDTQRRFKQITSHWSACGRNP